MRSFIAAAAFAALAKAQDLDWDVVLQATPLPDVTVPVVYATAPASTATATTVSYTSTAAAAAVTSALAADPEDGFPLNSALAKRAASTTTCLPQPTGAGPVPNDDSATGFLSYSAFAAAATGSLAAAPSGYVSTFTNKQASNNAYGYMGYTLLTEYNAQTCADKCTKINGCQAFNIYFERDPTVNPDSDSCKDPASTTQIKCVFWSGPVTSDNANNAGQWRNKFQVVIAGSNGYVNKSIATPEGYNSGVYLNNAAINAPLDCTGDNTYLETHVFNSGAFDAGLCAAACNSQANYARATVKTGFVKACNFFNTYILYKNGKSVGQSCVLYDQTWAQSYAKNTGYFSGSDVYTVGFSYSFSNKTDAGKPRYPCSVASASSAISSASLQPYCSTLLSYSPLVATQTTIVTPVVSSTTLVTVVSTASPAALKRRANATPSALTKFAASDIQSACALAVTKASTTSYTTATSTAAATTAFVTSTVYTTTTAAPAATQTLFLNFNYAGSTQEPWYAITFAKPGTPAYLATDSYYDFPMTLDPATNNLFVGAVSDGYVLGVQASDASLDFKPLRVDTAANVTPLSCTSSGSSPVALSCSVTLGGVKYSNFFTPAANTAEFTYETTLLVGKDVTADYTAVTLKGLLQSN